MPMTHQPTRVSDILSPTKTRRDACPEACGYVGAPIACMPTLAGWVARYQCPTCQRGWTTSWGSR